MKTERKDYSIEYIITFMEGIISFISPCMLPMLPLYISYFTGDTGVSKEHGTTTHQKQSTTTFTHALAFVIGFTIVFTLLGIFAGSIGTFLMKYQTIVNIICGLIIIYFGLSNLNIVHIPFFKGMNNTLEVKGLSVMTYCVYSIPATLFIDADGNIVASHLGAMSEDTLRTYIENLLIAK